MKATRIIFLSLPFALIVACSHPIEIVGNGDVYSASGTRNCYLEDYAAGRESCARNLVVKKYFETYYAVSRPGWKFDRWGNYCEDAAAAECSFEVSAAVVKQYWGAAAPPLIAVFSPISQAGLDDPSVDADPAADQREAARIPAEQEAASKAAEQAAGIAAEQESAIKAAEQASASVAEQSTAIQYGSVKLKWSIPVTRQNGASLRPAELDRYEIYITAQSTGQKKIVEVNNPLQTNHTISNLPPDVYRVAMASVDKTGLYSKLSATVTLKIGD